MEKILIELSYSEANSSLQFNIDIVVISLFVSLLIITYVLLKIKKSRTNVTGITKSIVPVEMKFSAGGLSSTYKIMRNYQNIEIAHRLYIELITRKAAIEIDEENDVIVEIYNSWYSLFQITRNELKNFKGELLNNNSNSKEIIRFATDILNKGLRPHLTLHQAKFSKWYSEKLEEENLKGLKDRESPQDIQKKYPEYSELILGIKEVNALLVDYSLKLNNFLNS